MSIRARLLLLALLATLVPVVLQTARHLEERRALIDANTVALAQLAQRQAEAISERVRGTAQLLYGLARASDLATDDRAACSAFLARVRERHPQYTGILTIRPDGSLFCDSLNSGRTLDLSDRAYFRGALQARDTVTLESAFGRLTGIPVLQVAYPVRSAGGELQFVLLASLNLARLTDSRMQALPDARLLLVDAGGTVLASSRTDAGREAGGSKLTGTPLGDFALGPAGQTRLLAGPDGVPAVWASAGTPDTQQAGLQVLASLPQHSILAQANHRLWQDLGLLAALALAVFLAVWTLAETAIRRPVAALARLGSQLAAGNLAARIPPPLPRGELGALAEQLNQAVQSLQQQRESIADLDARLRRSQRLEAVGQLTGGVAHDFNNLLTVVLGNAELLLDLRRDDPEVRQMVQMIADAAERGAQLTQRLLAFARKQALDPRVVDLNALVAGMDGMLRRTLGEHIDIELTRAAGLWLAVVDKGQLENALLNLCLNARDAMPDGGRLTLETANSRLDAEYAERHGDVQPGQYVMLAVSDTGCGIPAQNLQHVFEPFFSTKPPGRGTGLGLAMVYGFIKQSGGHVNLYSEPGQGTTVKLYLPRAAALVPDDMSSRAPLDPLQGGHESILLVEDDPSVRRHAAEQLRAFGYRVAEAADGPSALRLLQQGEPADLLFTDVVMPGGMNGAALAEAARRLRPGLAVLYTSGYTDNAIVHQGRLDAGALLLVKPYRRGEMARMVRAALAGGQASAPAVLDAVPGQGAGEAGA